MIDKMWQLEDDYRNSTQWSAVADGRIVVDIEHFVKTNKFSEAVEEFDQLRKILENKGSTD